MMKNEIKVWDPLVRSFHWILVISFTVAYLTSEDAGNVHAIAGYLICGLIIFRLIWGFIGSRYARFSDFIYGPQRFKQYVYSLKTSKPHRYIGHNPAGGWMVIALLLSLFVISYSGLKVYGLEGYGPLANNTQIVWINVATTEDEYGDDEAHEKGESDEEEFWEEIHEIASDFMLFLIALHITGVIVSSRMHKENLVKAMFTGKKRKEIE